MNFISYFNFIFNFRIIFNVQLQLFKISGLGFVVEGFFRGGQNGSILLRDRHNLRRNDYVSR